MPYISDFSPRDDYLGPSSGETLLLGLAPIMFGLIWSWFLLGTLMVQVYYYHMSFPKDHRLLKALVYVVFMLDLIQTGLTTHASYHTFVEYYSKPNVLNDPAKTITALPLFDGTIAALVQAFYAWRIWQLGQALISKVVLVVTLVVIVLLSALQTLSAMITAFSYIHLEQHPLISLPKVNTTLAIWIASGMFVDVIIALAMSYLVFKAKGTKSLLNSDRLLNKILIRVVATGVLTAFCALINIVVFVRYDKTDLYETPAYILGKLFSNALLVNLNIRSPGDKGRVVDLNTSPERNDLSTPNSMTFASPSQRERSGRVASPHVQASICPPGTELSTDVQVMPRMYFPEHLSQCSVSTSGSGRVHSAELRGISHAAA